MHGMINDDAPDHVRFNDVCAKVDAAMATAKLSPSQKKTFSGSPLSYGGVAET